MTTAQHQFKDVQGNMSFAPQSWDVGCHVQGMGSSWHSLQHE